MGGQYDNEQILAFNKQNEKLRQIQDDKLVQAYLKNAMEGLPKDLVDEIIKNYQNNLLDMQKIADKNRQKFRDNFLKKLNDKRNKNLKNIENSQKLNADLSAQE